LVKINAFLCFILNDCFFLSFFFFFTGNKEAAKATLDFNTKNTEQSETLGNLGNLVKIISYKPAE